MIPALVDGAELVWTILYTTPAIRARLVDGSGTYIYGPPGLPKGFVLRQAIMFLSDGGDANIAIPVEGHMFPFYCYGHDSAEAMQLFLLLQRALHRRGHSEVQLADGTARLQYAHRVGGPTNRVDPLEGWPFVYATFNIQFVEHYV